MSPHLVTGLQPSTQYTTPSRYRTRLSITNDLLVLRRNDYVSALGNGTAAVHTVHHTILVPNAVVYNKLPVGVEAE